MAGTACPSRVLGLALYFVGSVLFIFAVFCVVFYCCVCLRLYIMYQMLSVSLDCLFLIAPSVFCNVYIYYLWRSIKFVYLHWSAFNKPCGHVCVICIDFISVSMCFLLDYKTVLTIVYILFLFLLCRSLLIVIIRLQAIFVTCYLDFVFPKIYFHIFNNKSIKTMLLYLILLAYSDACKH